jgi:alpha-galactosidase
MTVQAEYVALHSGDSSVLFEVSSTEAPVWRYWGARLPEQSLPPTALRAQRPLPTYMLDVDQPLTLAPCFGLAWMGQSALLAHSEGRDFAQSFTRCTWRWIKPNQAVCFELHDDVTKLRLDVELSLDASSHVLSIQSRLHNLGDKVVDVQWLAAATLPLPGECETVRYYAGQHANEFLEQTAPLSRSIWKRESRRGRTSHDCFPGAVVLMPGATAHEGLVFGAHLAWSGNHQQSIEWLHDSQYQWQLGEWLAPGEVRLEPGQSLVTPECLATFSAQGLNGLAANFHTHLRGLMQWPGGRMRPRPVHLNTWEGMYFDVYPEPVKELASAAATLGVERFVLDDGWFHGRHSDKAALGDWWPDETKFPQGLGDLVAHVNALGMEFGLWVEPEMVSPDSDLFRAHPDWALQIAGRPLITARNQLVLDISRQEAADYLFAKLDTLLKQHAIAYLKWDHNRDLSHAGLPSGAPGYRAQVHAVYSLMQRIRKAHPQLEIESCSGGGGRIDFAVLRHTHRVWTSDCIDALTRVNVQHGFLQFFPPEIMGAHVGTAPAHTTGRTQSMAFRAAVALPGHLGVELDVRQLDDAQSQELRAWIALYKELRGQLHAAKVWRGDLPDGLTWQAYESANGEEVIVLIYRTQPTTHRYAPNLRLLMLDPRSRYRVQQIVPKGCDPYAGMQSRTSFFEQLASGGVEVHGAWAKQAGLPMPRLLAETAYLLRLQRQALADH